MKKSITWCLAGLMLIGLAGCNKAAKDADAAKGGEQAVVADAAQAGAESAAQAGAEAAPAAPAADAPVSGAYFRIEGLTTIKCGFEEIPAVLLRCIKNYH